MAKHDMKGSTFLCNYTILRLVLVVVATTVVCTIYFHPKWEKSQIIWTSLRTQLHGSFQPELSKGAYKSVLAMFQGTMSRVTAENQQRWLKGHHPPDGMN